MNIKMERAFVSDSVEILLLQKMAYTSEAEIYNDYSIEPLVQTLGQLQKQLKITLYLKLWLMTQSLVP